MAVTLTIAVDGASRSVSVPTAAGVRLLQLYYAHMGGDPELPQLDQLAVIVARLGKMVVDGAQDEKRREYQRQADADNAADTLPDMGV